MNRKSKFFVIATFIYLLLFVSGCSYSKAYDGPSRSRSELAVIKGFGVSIVRVNGREISGVSAGAEVLPGDNRVEFLVDPGSYSYLGTERKLHELTMKAEAGKEYAVSSGQGSGKLCAWELNEVGAVDYHKTAGCVR